jgi:hypothetical protein
MIIHKKLVIRRKASQTVQVRPVLVQTFRTFELLDSVAALRLFGFAASRRARELQRVSLQRKRNLIANTPLCASAWVVGACQHAQRDANLTVASLHTLELCRLDRRNAVRFEDLHTQYTSRNQKRTPAESFGRWREVLAQPMEVLAQQTSSVAFIL